jgi:hypothetical protein
MTWGTVGFIRAIFTGCAALFVAVTGMSGRPARHSRGATKANHGSSGYLLSPHMLLVIRRGHALLVKYV